MRALLLGGAVATLALVQTATAQTTIGWDAPVFSSSVWRGVSLTNKPVFQPDVYLTVPVGEASLTGGGWVNIDIGKYDKTSTSDISESGGTSAFNLAEFDPWAELGIPAGPARVTVGGIGYLYPNTNCGACLTKANNTWEIYGKVGLDAPLNPRVSAYYDVDKIKGLYVEGSVSHEFELGPTFPLTLGALAGWTGGQEATASEPGNFADKGLTHVELSASTWFSAGALSIVPSIHGVITNDGYTKISEPSATNTGFKLWGGVTISWSRKLGAEAEAEG
jgi:hypothetical protein